jgi:hypothetical protein
MLRGDRITDYRNKTPFKQRRGGLIRCQGGSVDLSEKAMRRHDAILHLLHQANARLRQAGCA